MSDYVASPAVRERILQLSRLAQIDLDRVSKRYGVERQRDAYGWESTASFILRLAEAMESKGELEKEESFPTYGEEEEKGTPEEAVPEPPREAEEKDFLSSLAGI